MSEKETKSGNSKASLRLADEAVDGEIVKSRALEAYERKLAGQSLSEIAEEMGYSSATAVSQLISNRLGWEAQFVEENDQKTVRALALARLEKQHQALWQSAMYGDIRANLALLQIADRYMKWSGADAGDVATGQATVLVVGGDEQAYLDKLKGMADG